MRDPRIIAQSSDPRFAQQNPRMVRIRTLHITYIYIYIRAKFRKKLPKKSNLARGHDVGM